MEAASHRGFGSSIISQENIQTNPTCTIWANLAEASMVLLIYLVPIAGWLQTRLHACLAGLLKFPVIALYSTAHKRGAKWFYRTLFLPSHDNFTNGPNRVRCVPRSGQETAVAI